METKITTLIAHEGPAGRGTALTVRYNTDNMMHTTIRKIIDKNGPEAISKLKRTMANLITITMLKGSRMPPITRLGRVERLGRNMRTQIPPITLRLPINRVLKNRLSRTTNRRALILTRAHTRSRRMLFILLVPGRGKVTPITIVMALLKQGRHLNSILLPLSNIITHYIGGGLLRRAYTSLVTVTADMRHVMLITRLGRHTNVGMLISFLITTALGTLTGILMISRVLNHDRYPTGQLSREFKIAHIALVVRVRHTILTMQRSITCPGSLELMVRLIRPELPFRSVLAQCGNGVYRSFSCIGHFRAGASFHDSDHQRAISVYQ